MLQSIFTKILHISNTSWDIALIVRQISANERDYSSGIMKMERILIPFGPN